MRRRLYLRGAVQESGGRSLRLGIGQLHGILKAQRQVACHEEPEKRNTNHQQHSSLLPPKSKESILGEASRISSTNVNER